MQKIANGQVGDPNRVVEEGREYTDNENGNIAYVKGDRVVVKDSDGNLVTQFKNSRSNTLKRIESGRWEPKYFLTNITIKRSIFDPLVL
ncbi:MULTISPECIES: hypothetical protein [Methylomonas]|uniref:Uncharacterized protein n=1 Tax=Methylomonas koyamae TaxID=702114 RepID=A0A177NMA9_9GAMM|nr:hypothetical protein [Methylomonas koyamae]OAI18170.1 hypothetical protein A1355_06290 [Methylomonas koyamae]